MPVCVPSRRGSMRIVAITFILPPGAGWTLTSPNGSTTRFTCAMTRLRAANPEVRNAPLAASHPVRSRKRRIGSIVLVLLDADVGRRLAGGAELQRQALPLVGALLLGWCGGGSRGSRGRRG